MDSGNIDSSRTSLRRTSKLGFLPSFSIRYRYRSVILTLFASSSIVISAFWRADLIISPSVYGSPPSNIVRIYASFIMACWFNYERTNSSQNTELNKNRTPPNKKNEVLSGWFVMSVPFNSEFSIGGIFHALDNVLRFAAGTKQRIWSAYIIGWLFNGKRSKKARTRHRGIMSYALNWQYIICMKLS